METVLYYFSGTGNSLALAKIVQQSLSARLVSIPSVINNHAIDPCAEVIGIITPVYYGDLPNIVKAFLQKLTNLENKTILLVLNYGGGSGYSIATAKKLLQAKQGKISFIYGIHMPQNAFKKPFEKPDKLFAEARKTLSNIQGIVAKREKGTFYSNRFIDLVQRWLFPLFKPLYLKSLLELSGIDANATLEEAVYNIDRTFAVRDTCNGCGICAQVCPVANIKIVDGKPQWLHHCENCIACYNWCPQKAIFGALVKGDYYYRHPDMKVKDLLSQKNGNTA